MAAEKKRGRWLRFLLIWAACLLLVGFAGCGVFYRYADVYERTRPGLVMDELMRRDKEAWKADLLATLPEDERGFEDMRALFEPFFEASVRPAELRCRPDLTRTGSDRAVYVVYAGRWPIADVTLRPKAGEKAQFGRRAWELDRIDCLDFRSSLASVTLEIDAPRDAALTLNGTPITEAYLSREAGKAPYLTPLEARFEGPGPFVRYRIEGLCGELAVADAEGRAFRREDTGDESHLRFVLDAEGGYGFSVEAPADAAIRVNGALLGPEDAGSSYDLGRDLGGRFGGADYRTVSYRAQGLYARPEISAIGAGGETLDAVAGGNGTIYFFYPDESAVPAAARTAAEDYFNAYMAYSSSTGSRHTAYRELLGRILPDTELYRYVQASTDGMYWASKTEIDYQELSFDHFHALSEDCVFCTVSFSADMTANTWYSELNYDMRSGYQLLLVCVDGQWLAAAQANLGE